MRPFSWLFIFLHFSFTSALAFGQPQGPFNYDDKGRRDPFLPLVDEKGHYLLEAALPYSFGELKLSGILWDPEGKSSALINNTIIEMGESICGFMIKNITKDSITVSKGGKEYIIWLSAEEGVKK